MFFASNSGIMIMTDNSQDPDKKDLDLHSSDGLADFFSDVGDDEIDDDYDEVDQLVDEVMALLENYAAYAGGLITHETIADYLKDGNHPDLDIEMVEEVVGRLKMNKILEDEIVFEEIPKVKLYIYDEKKIDEEMLELLKIFARKATVEKPEIIEQIGWDESRVDEVLQRFLDQKMVIMEGSAYILPSLSEPK